jgi:hypothetical protein
MQPILSKTEYLIYLDSPLHLWAYIHNKVDDKQIDTFLKHLFDQGNQVQTLAHKYIEQHLIPNEYSTDTDTLFEKTELDSNFQARMDFMILNPKTNLWDIYEIKSSKKNR